MYMLCLEYPAATGLGILAGSAAVTRYRNPSRYQYHGSSTTRVNSVRLQL